MAVIDLEKIGYFSEEERARAAAFARRRYVRWVWRQGLYAVAILGVYVSGLARTMSTESSGTQAVWNISALCLAVGWALSLPVAFIGARDEREQGLSHGWRRLPVRSLVWGLLLILIGPAWMQQVWDVVVSGYGQMTSAIIWLPVGLLIVPLIVSASAHKVDDPPTVARLASLIRRSRVRLDAVRIRKVMQGTRRQNAFVIGVWPTRRLVVFDTLAAEGPICLDAAVAHELGHMRLHHTIKRLAVFILVFGAAFVATVTLVDRLPDVYLRQSLPCFNFIWPGCQAFRAPDPTYVPVILLLWGAFGILLRPILVGFIRNQERDADLFGVRVTRDPLGFSLLLQRLALSNLADLDPNRVSQLLFATHGSIPDRIAWVRAEPLPALEEPQPPAATPLPEPPPVGHGAKR
ncbi:MAG TPA: M48 family metalloprotease [Actinomycetota bacterium]|jgi:STE24 endopeptidase|nr:M48 family metalloprotease [Actinomycetota bacterium]